jgi:hypothetical protein
MASLREEIEAILVDCYGEDEPGAPGRIGLGGGLHGRSGGAVRCLAAGHAGRGARLSPQRCNVLQCLVVREKRQRWGALKLWMRKACPKTSSIC